MFEVEIQRGLAYLVSRSEDGMFPCYISNSMGMADAKESPPDVASSIIVLDVLERLYPTHLLLQEVRRYVEARDRGGLFSYFDIFYVDGDDPVQYPADADDSAVGILVASGGRPEQRYVGAANRIIDNTDDDGVIQVWLEPKPGHHQSVDAVVCVNAIRLACLYGREKDVIPSIDYVIAHLKSGRYLQGTRYYPKPQVFLYFLAKLEAEAGILAEQRTLLTEAIKECLVTSSGPASLAIMITAAQLLGLPQYFWADKQTELAAMQQPDGSWIREALWRYGSRSGYFGSESLSTALIIEALSGKCLHD